MKKLADTCRRLLSIALNLFMVCGAHRLAHELGWARQIFTFYTEDSNIFRPGLRHGGGVPAVCIFTGGNCPAGSSGSSSSPPAACCSPF